MLWITKGYFATETIDATERAGSLAQKSGNLVGLVDLMISRGVTAWVSGDLAAASKLTDHALTLALREGSPTSLAFVYGLQTEVRYSRGDLAGAERNFIAGLKYFNDPGFKRHPAAAIGTFGTASWNAWALGRSDVARGRIAEMMKATDENNPYEAAWSGPPCTVTSGMASPLPTISYQTLPAVTLTYPSFSGHPNGNFELSADAAFVEADNKTKIGITNIAPATEHERLLKHG
jgi:hypothetical protein